MALGIEYGDNDGGEIMSIVKYDARAGRIFRIDRNNGTNESVDITNTFQAVFDFENIETGWISFDTGSAPHFAVARLGSQKPERPTDKHKQGLRMLVLLAKGCGGDLRELASTAKAFVAGLESLHNLYVAGVKDNAGKLPVVALKTTTPVTSGSGDKKSTNYQPTFEITAWVPRPAALVWTPKNGAPKPAPSTPPSTGSTQVSAPADEESAFG